MWDDGTPVEETLCALNDLVRWGKVRYVAVSNLKGWQLQKMVETARHKGWAPITCLQVGSLLFVVLYPSNIKGHRMGTDL